MVATSEVGTVITTIQQDTSRSIKSVDTTSENLATASELVLESGRSLDQIVDEAMTTAKQVDGIAAASEEQSAASEQITRSLEHINIIAGQTADAMRLSTKVVDDVTVQVAQLRDLVGKLRQVAGA